MKSEKAIPKGGGAKSVRKSRRSPCDGLEWKSFPNLSAGGKGKKTINRGKRCWSGEGRYKKVQPGKKPKSERRPKKREGPAAGGVKGDRPRTKKKPIVNREVTALYRKKEKKEHRGKREKKKKSCRAA